MILEIQDLCVSYGGIRALHGISLGIEEGEIVSVIGANGAGKSTTLRAISGLIRPESGDIRLDGQSLIGLPPHAIARLGVSHVPEGRGIFYNLSVMENLELATTAQTRKRKVRHLFEHVFELFPRLAERRKQLAGTLSGGEQQMLAIGRGLIMGGKIMLLDEPSMGLAPNLVTMIFETILRLNREGMTILLVEQNAYKAASIAHRVYALKTGEIIFSGSTEQEDLDEILHNVYLQ